MRTKGQKAHINDKRTKVGRIKFRSWATQILKARNIYINESVLVHIENRHGKDLEKIGMSPMDFVCHIVNNFTELREGSGSSYLLVVRRNTISNVAAIELVEYPKNKGCYYIRTATLYNNKQLLNRKILCANDH